jgi:hypothetical protein
MEKRKHVQQRVKNPPYGSAPGRREQEVQLREELKLNK